MSSSTSHVDVRFPGGKCVSATIDGHVIRTDQSIEHGGAGSAPEPFDLFLASLATCAGLYVLVFCQSRGIPTSELQLDQQQVFEDGKLRRIVLRVLLPQGFPEKYVDAVRAAAAGCKVKKTLLAPPEIEVVAVPAPAIAVPA
ncbi:MAG TPA: OsmC family protein [Polyangiaceae bacterium]|nr:OsmC family protein [Polyangiaceae bacterium]